jgi:hypothetical protein
MTFSKACCSNRQLATLLMVSSSPHTTVLKLAFFHKSSKLDFITPYRGKIPSDLKTQLQLPKTEDMECWI